MPPRMSNACARIGRDTQPIGGHRRGAFNHQSAGGVVERQEVQPFARLAAEKVGEGHRRRRGKVGHSRRLDGDVERMLEQPRW